MEVSPPPKGWAELRVCISDFASCIRHPALTPEQQGRLALAWTTIYSFGLATESAEQEWRLALAYTPRQWAEVREAFELALPGWRCPMLVREAARQAAVSEEKKRNRAHGRQRPSTDAHVAVAVASTDSKNQNLEHLCDESHESPKPSLKENPETSRLRKDWRESFDETFWPTYYPLRRGLPNPKASALAAWLKVREPTAEIFNQLMDELDACIREWKEPQYIPHAATWLNARIKGGVYYPSEEVSRNGTA